MYSFKGKIVKHKTSAGYCELAIKIPSDIRSKLVKPIPFFSRPSKLWITVIDEMRCCQDKNMVDFNVKDIIGKSVIVQVEHVTLDIRMTPLSISYHTKARSGELQSLLDNLGHDNYHFRKLIIPIAQELNMISGSTNNSDVLKGKKIAQKRANEFKKLGLEVYE